MVKKEHQDRFIKQILLAVIYLLFFYAFCWAWDFVYRLINKSDIIGLNIPDFGDQVIRIIAKILIPFLLSIRLFYIQMNIQNSLEQQQIIDKRNIKWLICKIIILFIIVAIIYISVNIK